jgi:hypothetical protein
LVTPYSEICEKINHSEHTTPVLFDFYNDGVRKDVSQGIMTMGLYKIDQDTFLNPQILKTFDGKTKPIWETTWLALLNHYLFMDIASANNISSLVEAKAIPAYTRNVSKTREDAEGRIFIRLDDDRTLSVKEILDLKAEHFSAEELQEQNIGAEKAAHLERKRAERLARQREEEERRMREAELEERKQRAQEELRRKEAKTIEAVDFYLKNKNWVDSRDFQKKIKAAKKYWNLVTDEKLIGEIYKHFSKHLRSSKDSDSSDSSSSEDEKDDDEKNATMEYAV